MTLVMPERTGFDDPEPQPDLADVVRSIHEDLDLPEGYRAEIIEGLIVVSASPNLKHAAIVKVIARTVEPALPEGYEAYENTTCEEPEGDRYIPDVAAWPVEFEDIDELWAFPGAHCAFAAEVTSARQESRDYRKAAGYARAGVPVYLIVDRSRRECVVHSEPENGRYKTTHTEPFGKPVELPLATTAVLDTSTF